MSANLTDALIYGDLSYLFLFFYIAIIFLVSYKHKWLTIVGIPCLVFMAYKYSQQTNTELYMWHIVLLIISSGMLLIANVIDRK